MTVAEAQRRIDSREFSEWIAYNNLSPIGVERLEFYLVYLLWMTACINHDGKSRKPEITDFLMAQPPRKPKTAAELEVVWRSFVSSHKNVQRGKRK